MTNTYHMRYFIEAKYDKKKRYLTLEILTSSAKKINEGELFGVHQGLVSKENEYLKRKEFKKMGDDLMGDCMKRKLEVKVYFNIETDDFVKESIQRVR